MRRSAMSGLVLPLLLILSMAGLAGAETRTSGADGADGAAALGAASVAGGEAAVEAPLSRLAALVAPDGLPLFQPRTPASVVSVYDGDTLTVDATPWPGLTIRTGVRLDGVDTPEIRGACEAEKAAALVARDRLRALAGEAVLLTDVRPGKYAGRVVARVFLADGREAAQVLIAEGLGRPYAGDQRQSWCPATGPGPAKAAAGG